MLTVIYAARLASCGAKVNAADPGYTATDLNGHRGTRSTADAASVVIRLACLDAAGPTGGFFSADGPVAW